MRSGPLVGDSSRAIGDAMARVLQARVDYSYRQFVDLGKRLGAVNDDRPRPDRRIAAG